MYYINGYPQLKTASSNSTFLKLVLVVITTVMPFFPLSAKKKEKSNDLLLTQYNQAKALYKSGNYSEAKIVLEALKETKSPPALTPYIHFYYALATYHNGEKQLATQTFDWIRLHYLLWNKQDEVCYWSAQCKFQERRFAEALQLLALIKDKRMAKSVKKMKKYFLNQIEDEVCLQQLVEAFDQEAILKKNLYKKAAYQAYITQDFTLVDQLKQQYNVGDYIYDPLRHLVSNRKTCYRIAVFFPFFVNELDYEAATSSFVIDLYQGIQLATETLAKEGITLQLFSFDTKNNAVVTQALLEQEALQYMDLIIGPLYPDTIPLVAAFSKQHKINFVNPISNNVSIIQSNPFAFLFQPTIGTYAQKAAQLTLSDIQNKSIAEPSIAVFYTSEREDIVQAAQYKQLVEQVLGKPLDWFVELPNNNTIKDFFAKIDRSVQETVTEEVQETDGVQKLHADSENEIKKEDLTKITHIYVPSQHKLLVSNVVSLPFKLGIRPQIIGYEQWIKEEIITVHQLSKLPILFLSPHYIDFSRPALATFRDRFFQETATFPTLYSYIGYEMMLFFGRMLATHGTYFQKEWGNVHYNGVIFQQVYYGQYHSNQHITLLRFKDDKFVVAEEL